MNSYVCIDVEVEEMVCIDALVHDRLSLHFGTGAIYIEAHGGATRLHWPTNMTGTLMDSLKSLNSYQREDGSARLLVQKIEALSNRG